MGCTSSKNADVVQKKDFAARAPFLEQIPEMCVCLAPYKESTEEGCKSNAAFQIYNRLLDVDETNKPVISVDVHFPNKIYGHKSDRDEIYIKWSFNSNESVIGFLKRLFEFMIDFALYHNGAIECFLQKNRGGTYKILLPSFHDISGYIVEIIRHRRSIAFLVVQYAKNTNRTRYITYFIDDPTNFVHGCGMDIFRTNYIIKRFALVCKVSEEEVRANFGTN